MCVSMDSEICVVVEQPMYAYIWCCNVTLTSIHVWYSATTQVRLHLVLPSQMFTKSHIFDDRYVYGVDDEFVAS